jgi:hypothetical protein
LTLQNEIFKVNPTARKTNFSEKYFLMFRSNLHVCSLNYLDKNSHELEMKSQPSCFGVVLLSEDALISTSYDTLRDETEREKKIVISRGNNNPHF